MFVNFFSTQITVNSTDVKENNFSKNIIKTYNLLGNQIKRYNNGLIIEIDSRGNISKKN